MSAPAVFRFAAFELNAGTCELRRHGDLLKLAPQPLKVLELLVEAVKC
jgi:DNA-binding winged helix-turn-helix (wHTH) protein